MIQLVKTEYIAYAGDQWYLHRQNDANGRFFWKVAQQGHYKDRPPDETRQGIYLATPEGQLLGSVNSWSLEKTLGVFRAALERWRQQPEAATSLPAVVSVDTDYRREPPPGGLILDVFTRIPLPPAPGGDWSPNQATGRDHLWIREAEWRALLPASWQNGTRYPAPRAFVERLARFHLVDNVRGEPDMWTRADVESAECSLVVEDAAHGLLRLEGNARLHRGEAHGYIAHLQGYLVYDRRQQRFTRFDLLSWGEAWGEGRYTGGAPHGRFPLVIALSLAGNTPADRIPPQAIRARQDYFATGDGTPGE